MRKKLAVVVVVLLFFMSLSGKATEAREKSAVLFSPEQLASLQGEAGLYTRRIVMLDDVLYAYLSNAKVYAWRTGEVEPALFCQLPEIPKATMTVYESLDSVTKAQWGQMVSFLAAGNGTLWGVNVFNGKMGEITAEGIQWHDVLLDIESLWPDDSRWPLRVASAFAENNNLYAYVALDNAAYPRNNYIMLVFDLTDGSCKELEIHNAQSICVYKPGEILLLHITDEGIGTLSVMELSTGSINTSLFQPILDIENEPVGGLVYNKGTNRLFFTTKDQVWVGKEGESYVPTAIVPVSDAVGDAAAFILKDGRYALFSDSLYLRTAGDSTQTFDELLITGAMDPGIYNSFSRENPNVHVTFSGEMLSSDTISKALVTGDDTADVYAVFADSTFKAAVRKGYAASLGDSTILTEDIKTMYPHIQQVITDDSGVPVAYPYSIMLLHWQINDTLWQRVFGQKPHPTTYDQFLDAMLLWESNLADEYPDLGFTGDFDHVYWIRAVVNAFAQQYGHAESSLKFSNPTLIGVLEKLERVRDARKANGRSTQFLKDGGFVPKADIFITFGGNNVLQDPDAIRPLESYEQDGLVMEGVYQVMPTLVFVEGEDSYIPGAMIVWFVNPFSPRKALAISYLEYAAKKEYNILTYYATHPEANEPVENQGYQQRLHEMEGNIEKLNELLKSTEGADLSNVESNLKLAQTMLTNQKLTRWRISENAIRIYRALVPSIRFFEDNPYVIPDRSRMLDQLENLFQRYADGNIFLDDFLSELDSKMRLMYLEGQ